MTFSETISFCCIEDIRGNQTKFTGGIFELVCPLGIRLYSRDQSAEDQPRQTFLRC